MRRLPLLGLLLALAAPGMARAISESNYAEDFNTKVVPYLAEKGAFGDFQGRGGQTLKYLALEQDDEVGAIVLVQGFGDSYWKYREFFYDLASSGYSVYTFDNRGQGVNPRLGQAPGVGHVDDFEDYVADVKTFVDQVVSRKPHAHRFLMGHSMGGAIATLYTEEHPTDFQGLILSAPMLEINTHGTPLWLGRTVAGLNCAVGRGSAYFPGQGKPPTQPSTFETNHKTHSRARWENRKNLPVDQLGPQILGPSSRWISSALKTIDRVIDHAGEVKEPVLLFQAELDTEVLPGGQDRFCASAAHCKKVVLTGSGHSTVAETDAIRDLLFQNIRSFTAPVPPQP